MTDPQQTPEMWAVLELLGHVRIAGKISEEEKFGTKLGRIDIPSLEPCPRCNPSPLREVCLRCKGTGRVEAFITQYFGGGSVYRLTPVTEETARRVARECQPAPVRQLSLPAPDEDDDDEYGDVPPYSPTYLEAPAEVVRMADAVKRQHHGPLVDAKVTCKYLFAHAKVSEQTGLPDGPAIKHHGWPAKALIRVNNLRDRVAGLDDVTMIFDGDQWHEWTSAQQLALIDHEWEHAELVVKQGVVVKDDCGRPRVRLRPHDFQVAGFDSIVQRHGSEASEADSLRRTRDRWVQKSFAWEEAEVPA